MILSLAFIPLWFIISSLYDSRRRMAFFYTISCCRNREKAAYLFRAKYLYMAFFHSLAILFLVVSLSSPGIAGNAETVSGGSSYFANDTVFLIDISRSMTADDGEGGSRLEKSIRAAASMVSASDEGRFGIVVFKGDGYKLLPLTSVKEGVLDLLEGIGTEMFSSAGTDIGEGLMTALEAFPDHENTKKSIYLFTDGEEPEKGCFGSCRDLVSETMAAGEISLYIVPPDMESGSPVPGTDIVSVPDRAMIEKLAALPGAVVLPFSGIHDSGSIRGQEGEEDGRYDFAPFFAAAGAVAALAAMVLRGIRWQGII